MKASTCRLGSVSSLDLKLTYTHTLSSCSSFGQSAKRSSASEEVEKFCLRISFLLGEHEKKKESSEMLS